MGRTKIVKLTVVPRSCGWPTSAKHDRECDLDFPDSPGIPRGFAKETLIATFNDVGSVEKLFNRYHKDIAAVIVEPVCGNMGVIPPGPTFLSSLRTITRSARYIIDIR